MTNEVKPSGGYEKKDVNIPVILAVSFIGIMLLVVMVVVLADFFKIQKENAVYELVLSQESKDMVELRAFEQEQLNTYKLLDAEKGIYQIPIQQAMHLLAKEFSESK